MVTHRSDQDDTAVRFTFFLSPGPVLALYTL